MPTHIHIGIVVGWWTMVLILMILLHKRLSNIRLLLRWMNLGWWYMHLNIITILLLYWVVNFWGWYLGCYSSIRLLYILMHICWYHINWLIKIDVLQMRKVNWYSLALDSRHKKKTTFSAFASNFHICYGFGWQTQAVELFICFYIPEAHIIIGCCKK